MILGVYADLHSNLPALHAMQSSVGPIDHWVALGDSVGLYPQVNEVLDWQRQNEVIYVQGDHEEALITGGQLEGSYTGSESIYKQSEIISKVNLEYLTRMQCAYDLNLDGVSIRFAHFLTPESCQAEKKYAIDLSVLDKIYQKYDYVFFGHTHLPTVLYGKNTVFINPGSAGFPIDVLRRCSMVTFNTCSLHFEFVRFDYDTNLLINTVMSEGFNQKLVSYIKNGHRWK